VPHRAPHICSKAGCGRIVSAGSGGYCDIHRYTKCKRYRELVGKTPYNYRWQKSREVFLRRNPLCMTCKDNGIIVPATVVDHREPHQGNQTLFWNEANWQAMCKSCHDTKTNMEIRERKRNAYCTK